MNRIVAAIKAKSKNYNVRLGGVIANRSAATDQIDRFNAAIGLKTPRAFWRSRRHPSLAAEEIDAVRDGGVARGAGRAAEYMRLAATLWAGTEQLTAAPMKDRDIFDFLGFD